MEGRMVSYRCIRVSSCCISWWGVVDSKQSANIGHDPLTDDGTWWECMVADSLAEGYRDEALTYRNEAEDFAESAASSAGSAATSAANASISESNAAVSASNAAASETNAAISAQNAAESESNASASETKAQQWLKSRRRAG